MFCGFSLTNITMILNTLNLMSLYRSLFEVMVKCISPLSINDKRETTPKAHLLTNSAACLSIEYRT